DAVLLVHLQQPQRRRRTGQFPHLLGPPSGWWRVAGLVGMLIRGPVVRVRDHLPMLCGLALVVWLAGCTTGPKLVIPTGKLLNRGAPLTSDTKLGVTLTFHADAREGRPPAS